MTTRTVTFEVDTAVLFDMLHKMNRDASEIGKRVVGAMLAEPGLSDILGMALYGIHMPVPQVEQVPA